MDSYSFLRRDRHTCMFYRTIVPLVFFTVLQLCTSMHTTFDLGYCVIVSASVHHACARALEWVANVGWQLSWAEVKARGPVTERTEGSSIIIKNDSSAPYCGLTASSSQAVGLFVRLLCQFEWSIFFESMHFSAPIIRWGKRRAEDEKKKVEMRT